MRNETCILITVWAEGSQKKRKETEVYCRRKSAARTEFYAAYAAGLRPRFILEIDPADWEWAWEGTGEGNMPAKVIYRGAEYNIYRDYVTNESTMELTVG